MQFPRNAGGSLGTDFEKDGRVVTLAEAPRYKQRRASRLLKGVLKLHRTVSGIEINQDGADFGDRELRNHPLGVVGGPDPHPLALLDAQTQKSPRSALDLAPEFGIRVALVLVANDQSGALGIAAGGAVQQLAYGDAREWRSPQTVAVTQVSRLLLLNAHARPRN